MTIHLNLRDQPTPTRLKLVASALLAVPVAVLLLFAIGEVVSGEISGVQHIPEALLLFLLLVAAWRYPRLVGIGLLCFGTLLLVAWLVLVSSRGDFSAEGWGWLMWLGSGIVIFGLPLLAGWLLLRASRMTT